MTIVTVPDYVSKFIDTKVDIFIKEHPGQHDRENIRQALLACYMEYGVIGEIVAREPELTVDELKKQLDIETDLADKRWNALNEIYENSHKHSAWWCKKVAAAGMGISLSEAQDDD